MRNPNVYQILYDTRMYSYLTVLKQYFDFRFYYYQFFFSFGVDEVD